MLTRLRDGLKMLKYNILQADNILPVMLIWMRGRLLKMLKPRALSDGWNPGWLAASPRSIAVCPVRSSSLQTVKGSSQSLPDQAHTVPI
jgi:hypothetical protein